MPMHALKSPCLEWLIRITLIPIMLASVLSLSASEAVAQAETDDNPEDGNTPSRGAERYGANQPESGRSNEAAEPDGPTEGPGAKRPEANETSEEAGQQPEDDESSADEERAATGAQDAAEGVADPASRVDAQTGPIRTEAAQLDASARAAFNAGQLVEAAQLFERANRLVSHPATLYNAALAYDRAQWRPQAADAYLECLNQAGLDEQRTSVAQERLRELRLGLAFVVVSEPAGARLSVGHKKRVEVPAAFHLAPGEYRARIVDADGTTFQRELSITDPIEVRLEFSAPLKPVPATEVPRTAVVEEPEVDSSLRTWGWVSLGAGAGFAGAATWFGVSTLDAVDDFDQSQRMSQSARDRAVRFRSWTNLSWGAAALATGAGLVMLTVPLSSNRTTVEATPGGLRVTREF